MQKDIREAKKNYYFKQFEDFKSDIPLTVSIQEATGIPLARIPSGTESQGTLETDSSAEIIQPEQPGEEGSSEDTPTEQVGGETAVSQDSVEAANDPTKVTQSVQPEKDTAVVQQSIEDAEAQQVKGEGHLLQGSTEETTADHPGKKVVSQTSRDRSLSRTETSTLVVNVGGSARYFRFISFHKCYHHH